MSKIGFVQDMVDELNFNRLELLYATHTDLPKFRKAVKIEATKAAKEKAEYMLAAVGAKLGKPLFVREGTNSYRDADNQDLDPYRGNAFIRREFKPSDEKSLGVQDIVLKFSVFIRFEIE